MPLPASASGQASPTRAPSFPTAKLWSTELPSAPSGPPVVVRDRVVVPLAEGLIVARSLSDGSEAWRASLKASTDLGAGEDTVVVPLDLTVEALEVESGRRRWTAETGRVTAPPLVRGGWVVVAGGEHVTAIRESDGRTLWTKKIALIEHRPAADGDVLFVSVADGRVLALNLLDGSLLWERLVGTAPTEPIVLGGRLYVQVYGTRLLCLQSRNGYEEWNARMGAAIVGTAAASDDYLFVTGMDNLLRGYDRGDGALEWKHDLRYRPSGGPIVLGETVLVPGRMAALSVFDTRTRKVSRQLALPDPAVTVPGIAAPSSISGALLAVVTNNLGKPWLLTVAGEPPPALPPLAPLSVLPGESLSLSWPLAR